MGVAVRTQKGGWEREIRVPALGKSTSEIKKPSGEETLRSKIAGKWNILGRVRGRRWG